MKKEEQKVLSNEEIYNLFGKRKINAKEFELVCQLNAKYPVSYTHLTLPTKA